MALQLPVSFYTEFLPPWSIIEVDEWRQNISRFPTQVNNNKEQSEKSQSRQARLLDKMKMQKNDLLAVVSWAMENPNWLMSPKRRQTIFSWSNKFKL